MAGFRKFAATYYSEHTAQLQRIAAGLRNPRKPGGVLAPSRSAAPPKRAPRPATPPGGRVFASAASPPRGEGVLEERRCLSPPPPAPGDGGHSRLSPPDKAPPAGSRAALFHRLWADGCPEGPLIPHAARTAFPRLNSKTPRLERRVEDAIPKSN